MGQHLSSIGRQRALVYWSPAAILAGALAAASCGHVTGDVEPSTAGEPSNTPGSSSPRTPSGSVASTTPSDMVVDGAAPDVSKASCGDSTENLPYAIGYTPNPNDVSQAQMLVNTMSNTALANQMRGTSPGSAGAANYADIFRTPDDTTTGVRGLLFRDGPRGVVLAAQLPAGQNGYSTAFPVASARGASWDLDLEYKIGADMGDEMLASGNTVLLAPVINILRHPAWGRSQETYGEDSFLLGRFGSAFTIGVQQYVPACAKHYAANNVEDGRAAQIAQMDEQTLHEIYGRQFEMVIQDGGVACVMAAYNEVDSGSGAAKATINKELLTDMLRTTFGFQGFVLSDWWAMPPGQNAEMASQQQMYAQEGVSAGLNIELPWAYNYSQLEAVATPTQLRTLAQQIIQQKLRFQIAKTGVPVPSLGLKRPTTTVDSSGSIANNDGHIADALQSAREGMVLLKNDHGTLPINRSTVHTIAVIGASVGFTLTNTSPSSGTVDFATDVRLGDLGSSRVFSDPAKSYGPYAGIAQVAGSNINVVTGSSASLADSADFVVVVAGLTPEDEGEEYTGAGDRVVNGATPSFALDAKAGNTAQNDLISAVAAKNKPMVVVLEGGSVIDMPWLAQVPAVVMAWYPGMEGGVALGELLFGADSSGAPLNFSGKLPVTWPQSENDLPPFNQGGATGGATTMDYYLGYRYFDQYKKTPLFPFGYGLSYTTFQYTYLGVPCATVTKNSVFDVTVEVKNTGTVPGNEVSFLFVSYPATTKRRSVKELKGFHRTSQPIMPGETVSFPIRLRVQDLKYWDTGTSSWQIESGPVAIQVGPSADPASLVLSDMIMVQ